MLAAGGSTGGSGGQGGSRGRPLRPRAKMAARGAFPLWRGPLGALALAVAATGYWSTVAWLVASRSAPVLLEEAPELTAPPDCPPRRHYYFRDRLGDHYGHRPIPGYRPFTLQPRELGLAWGTPPLVLTDDPLDQHR